ncbi:uncharacterized protein LOC125191933 [Salvia hispanica]|uniref:uncharacterized protein LOC125191933 n=1 Tax=Salvia hispanica TaxID=49212 RepID=UPI0020095853|nr:uncharacterized protein LOC125191933 [Salvia hispanica]
MSLSDRDCTRLFEEVQNKLDSTMPWIGLYVAAASAACVLAIAADIVNGLYSRRRWIPCKFFSLNAFSLAAVLAVVMKLPVDLTGTDISSQDQYTRINSLAFMCIFIISLGSMKNNEMLLNIAALGVLVITITVNVCIHIVQTVPLVPDVLYMFRQQIAMVAITLLLFAMTYSVSLIVVSAKRYMELKYNMMHKLVSNRRLGGSIDEVVILVKGYWVMAEPSNPQFVLARSSITPATFLITISISLILSVTSKLWRYPRIINLQMAKYCAHNTSNYSWSIDWIELIQTFGVIVGVVACGCRVINDGPFKAARASTSFRDAFKLNKHWTLKLVEWRDTPLPFRVQNRVCKKLLYDIVRFVLNFCIGVQILFVSAAKPAQILSVSHEKLCQVLRAKFGSTTLFRFCKRSLCWLDLPLLLLHFSSLFLYH